MSTARKRAITKFKKDKNDDKSFPLIEELDDLNLDGESGALTTNFVVKKALTTALAAQQDEEEEKEIDETEENDDDEENSKDGDCSECRLTLERKRANQALLCFQDHVKIGATIGGAAGTGLGAAGAYILCMPSMFCAPKKDRTVYMRKARNFGGGLGLYAGGTAGAGIGVVSSFFTMPCAYFKGRPAVCDTMNKKLNEKVLGLLIEEEEKPQIQQMR